MHDAVDELAGQLRAEPGSGRRSVLLAVNFRAIYVCPAQTKFVLRTFGLKTAASAPAYFFLAARRGGFLCSARTERACFVGDALAVEHAPDDVVADARQVADAAAPDQDDRVLLEVVPFTADVAVISLPLESRTRATLRRAEFGFLGSSS